MPRRKRHTKKKSTFKINKYHIGVSFILIGLIFFFTKKVAPDAPVLSFLSKFTEIAFGENGLIAFFIMCILVGIMILLKGYMMKTLIKQFILLVFLSSALFNFEVIDITRDGATSIVNRSQSNLAGGYFSWPLYRALESTFGQSKLAIQIIIIILTISVISRILYSLNFKLPKIPIGFQIDQEKVPEKKIEKKSTPYITRESHTSSDSDLMNKIKQATGLETQNKNITLNDNKGASNSGSLLRDGMSVLFKKKLEEKIEKTKEEKIRPEIHFSGDKPTFPVSLLKSNIAEAQQIDEKSIVEKAQALQHKLNEFGVVISIEGFDIGPSVVQIRIKLAEGIKISSVVNLMDNIKLSLRTKSVKMVAPIPGTDCIGIQIPNPKPKMVCLGDVFSSIEFQKGMQKSETTLALGKGIDGSIAVSQLDSMPHLLVAGATGSGKSVGLNNFILSLMYQNSPSDLKFLMVDPKQVELGMYQGLPYLLAPIVFDSGKAVKLLQRTVDEMERRYTVLRERGLKQLSEFNSAYPAEKMYRIVFIIDEMADMMMSSSANRKEAENCINRIAAKARAVGIHLILCTQRPSVNVITGLIKANIPARVSFAVTSEIDSRTILGHKGAEDLVGKGDMLYLDTKVTDLRVQAAFVDTKEIESVVESLKNKYMQGLSEDDVYSQEIINALESKNEGGTFISTGGGSGSGGDEELIEQAIQIISETRKASTTMIQRKLGIGFARAARIMDTLEERGYVGPQEGAKGRDIFI